MKKLVTNFRTQWLSYKTTKLYKQVDALHFEANHLIRNGRREEALLLLEKANNLRMKML